MLRFQVFLAARVDPRGSCAGTRAGRLFLLVQFWYQSACDTRADSNNLLGGGPGGDDEDNGVRGGGGFGSGGCVVMMVVLVW